MTMRITKNQKIGSMVAIDVRNLLRKCSGAFRDDWMEEELLKLSCKRMGLYSPAWHQEEKAACRSKSARLIRNLVKEGFIELDEKRTQEKRRYSDPADQDKRWYKLTESGSEFCRATAAKPVHRKKADEAIQGLMERVRIVNEDDFFLYRVTTVVLYGSYARGAERPADVDLAIDVERKISDVKKFHEACWKHLDDSGRECRRIGYEFEFPHDEVFVFLRQSKRTLSLHALQDFIGMEKHENFSYEVLFGDKNAISQMLGEPQRV